MTKLTQATAVAIATAASQVRGDWDHPGILAALRVEADKGTSAEDVFVAIANLCANPEARTPGLLNKPGSWWTKPAGRIVRRGDHNVPCPDHPTEHDMPCPVPPEPVDPDVIANVRAALNAAPKYVPDAVKRAQALENQEATDA